MKKLQPLIIILVIITIIQGGIMLSFYKNPLTRAADDPEIIRLMEGMDGEMTKVYKIYEDSNEKANALINIYLKYKDKGLFIKLETRGITHQFITPRNASLGNDLILISPEKTISLQEFLGK